MSAMKFFMPSVNQMGSGCLEEAIKDIGSLGFKQALIVTDQVLNKIGLVGKVAEQLGQKGIDSVIYDGTQPNPTCSNVEEGVELVKQHDCDFIISLGGGSPHDCAKGIARVKVSY